jgi:hypothetical protein
MKLQLDGSRIRLRLAEAELAALLAEGLLDQAWPCPDGGAARCRLSLAAEATAGRCAGNLMDLQVVLPDAPFRAFADERPRRDGFGFACGPVGVSVEVDVRDSHRVRRAATPPGQSVPD